LALIGRMDVIGPLLWSFNMYKLLSQEIVFMVDRNVFIPFDPANTDYQQFKKDVMDGAELRDSDGDVMSQADATEFVSNLP